MKSLIEKLKKQFSSNKNEPNCHISENDKPEEQGGDATGTHFERVQTWKLWISLPVFVFAIWATVGHFNENLIFDWIKNPWFFFSLATFSLLVFIADYVNPVVYSIKNKKLSITLFLAIAVVTCYVYSLVSMGIYYNDHNEFWHQQLFAESIEIMFIVYIGHLIEEYVTSKTRKDMDSILSLFEKEAIKLVDGKEIKVKTEDLKPGDIVVVRNGAKFPVDGIIIEGKTTVDESTFTGESIPVNKDIDSNVFGGSISNGQLVLVKVTHTLSDSMVSKIVESVKSIRADKNRPAKLAQKLSNYVLPFILIAGVTSLFAWGFSTGDWNRAASNFVTTIIIACPMAFILLPPTTSLISSAMAARRGVMFNNPDIFEEVKGVNAIAFDKTGTLTEGKLDLIKSTIDESYNDLIRSMENVSTHPIASAIVEQLYGTKDINVSPNEDPGHGVTCEWEGKKYFFGSFSFIKESNPSYKDEQWVIEAKNTGATFSYLATNGEVLGVIQLEDKLKESAIQAIKKIKEKNIEIYVLTGDNENAAHYIASKLEIPIENVFANLKPENKSEIVAKLQSEGKSVAFVGDGINDTIALEKADVGIGIGSGSDTAIDSSDIVLKKNDLSLILFSLQLSVSSLRTITFGIIGACIYIGSIVPIAAAGLLLPIFGAIGMVVNDLWPLAVSSTLFRYRVKK